MRPSSRTTTTSSTASTAIPPAPGSNVTWAACARAYAAKRQLLLETLERELPESEVSGVSAGLHLLVWLPPGVDEQQSARARERGVAVRELHRHCATPARLPAAFLIGFASPTETELRRGASDGERISYLRSVADGCRQLRW